MVKCILTNLRIWFSSSEVHAAESVAYLNRALVRLQDIWEEIGIPEEQRLQRTNDVHKHIKVSSDTGVHYGTFWPCRTNPTTASLVFLPFRVCWIS